MIRKFNGFNLLKAMFFLVLTMWHMYFSHTYFFPRKFFGSYLIDIHIVEQICYLFKLMILADVTCKLLKCFRPWEKLSVIGRIDKSGLGKSKFMIKGEKPIL